MDYITQYNILVIVGAFILATFIEMLVLPRVIFIAKKKKLFDLPDKRKKHTQPIPRLGGLTFTPIILLVCLFSLFIRFKLHIWGEELFFYRIPETILFVCGLLLIFLLGAKDDLVGVKYDKKFIIQFIAALCIVGSGVYINNLYGLLGFYEIPDIVGIILSLVFIIFTTNAINLIDGADGLASGISAVALICYGVLFGIYGLWTYSGMAFVTLGILIPFFYYNFFHNTRKIFMGDTGSLTLGFVLSFMILRLAKFPPLQEVVTSGQLLLILSALIIPLFDAFKVMVVRISLGRGPFSPDRNHIHHKLIDLGLSKRKTVAYLILSAIFIVLLNWTLLNYINCNVVLVLDITICVLSNMLIYRQIRKKINKEKKTIQINPFDCEKIKLDI